MSVRDMCYSKEMAVHCMEDKWGQSEEKKTSVCVNALGVKDELTPKAEFL